MELQESGISRESVRWGRRRVERVGGRRGGEEVGSRVERRERQVATFREVERLHRPLLYFLDR